MHNRRRPTRHLHPEERALWHEVARSARPMEGRDPFAIGKGEEPAPHPLAEPPARVVPKAPKSGRSGPAPAPLQPFRIGARAPTLPRAPDAPAMPLRMDAKSFARLSRGKLAPDARIDLHGLTLAEAQPELMRFISAAHGRGARLVLVITGKGRGGPDEDDAFPRQLGALRREVPHWLSRAPLGGMVLQVAPAHPRHGGSGAYYVYLRRPR